MNTRNKASGFFIVEVLIVLVLVALLTLLLLPNFSSYTDRAKFMDVIRTAESLKPAVEACYLQTSALTSCTAPAYGIPTDVTSNYGGNVNGSSVSQGVITVTGLGSKFSSQNGSNLTFVLTPVTNANGIVEWNSTAAASTCRAKGLC